VVTWKEVFTMEKHELDRIIILTRKQKTTGLTRQEAEERRELYIKYLAFVRVRVEKQLEEAGCRK
jgi:uncharacterized protein YnzC (UPF0291/DUF896 family)